MAVLSESVTESPEGCRDREENEQSYQSGTESTASEWLSRMWRVYTGMHSTVGRNKLGTPSNMGDLKDIALSERSQPQDPCCVVPFI